jgi:hypothetical protein
LYLKNIIDKKRLDFLYNINIIYQLLTEVIKLTDIIKRLKVEDIYAVRQNALKLTDELHKIDDKLKEALEPIKGYRPYRFENHLFRNGVQSYKQYYDQTCWRYLVSIFELNKYMLCTDYDKLIKDIDQCNLPEFNIENANGWVDGVKELIYDNVKKLVVKVFESITTGGMYYTGPGASYNKAKKKRNNNGIDKHFILTTHDYNMVFHYWSQTPTVTDDLEKVCYILSGKKLPTHTVKDRMRDEKVNEVENDYFRIKLCKNGNTHYWINDDIRNKLNLFGSGRDVIGENIRIKILD